MDFHCLNNDSSSQIEERINALFHICIVACVSGWIKGVNYLLACKEMDDVMDVQSSLKTNIYISNYFTW